MMGCTGGGGGGGGGGGDVNQKQAIKVTTIQNVSPANRKGTRYKGKQIAVPQPEMLAKNTLDATHKSRIKHFKDERKSLNAKKKELTAMNKELILLNQIPITERDFRKVTLLEESIKRIEKEIAYIESGQGELDYYARTGELLMEYYEHINSMKKGKKGGKKKNSNSNGAGGGAGQPSASVYDMFMKPQASESLQTHLANLNENGEPVTNRPQSQPPSSRSAFDSLSLLGLDIGSTPISTSTTSSSSTSTTTSGATVTTTTTMTTTTTTTTTPLSKPQKFLGNLTGFVEKQDAFNRADYFDEYLSIIDPHFVRDEMTASKKPDEDSFCQRCNCVRYMHHAEAMMICPECGSYEAIVIDSDKPNYKDPPVEISNFPYRRINHFNECLSQFQAKESTEIPQIVYDTILMEMKKERITNMADLTKDKVHKYLKKQTDKKFKFTNYYEHIPHIINKLTGIKPKTLTAKQEDELRTMFHIIQEPYERHKPKNRKNFLNYNYVLYKFCELKGYDEFLDCFPTLKSKEKLYQHDLVWKKICKELGWTYYAST